MMRTFTKLLILTGLVLTFATVYHASVTGFGISRWRKEIKEDVDKQNLRGSSTSGRTVRSGGFRAGK